MSLITRKSKALPLTLQFRIYIFGGGQIQKKRFNDTVRISLPDFSKSEESFDKDWNVQVGLILTNARNFTSSIKLTYEQAFNSFI